MKISIEKNLIHKSLSHVQSIVEKKNTIPILSNILLEATDSSFVLFASEDFGKKRKIKRVVKNKILLTIFLLRLNQGNRKLLFSHLYQKRTCYYFPAE